MHVSRTVRFLWRLERFASYLDAVPVLAGEGVDGLLLETLLALGQSLVPVKSIPISGLFVFAPLTFGLGSCASSLGSEESTYLPTAIFARFGSQRRAMVR